MRLTSDAFMVLFIALALLFGGVTLLTLRRIKRSPLSEAEKNSWQLLVYAVPVFGLLGWYANELRMKQGRTERADPERMI